MKKSFVENIKFKLKRPTMSCKFKTGQRPVSKFISCMVYSDTGSWKHTGCYHNHPLHSVTTGICVSVRKTIETIKTKTSLLYFAMILKNIINIAASDSKTVQTHAVTKTFLWRTSQNDLWSVDFTKGI